VEVAHQIVAISAEKDDGNDDSCRFQRVCPANLCLLYWDSLLPSQTGPAAGNAWSAAHRCENRKSAQLLVWRARI